MSEANHKDQFEITLAVAPELHGLRLDVFLAQQITAYSRGLLQAWVRDGHVQIDGKNASKPREKVCVGQSVHILAPLQKTIKALAQPIELHIVHEDPQLLVVNKPAGLVVHPGNGNPDQTLMNALLYHCPTLSNLPRAGIIHRLDKQTSGLMVVPKTLEAHNTLCQQIQNRTVERHYYALVRGTMIAGKTVDAPIARHPQLRTHMAVVSSGRSAISHFRIHERFAHHTLLTCKLETGRTHQIRVHCQWMKHPIVGDPVYNRRFMPHKGAAHALIDALAGFKRQALHAYELAFHHPKDDQWVTFSAPMPADLQTLLDIVRRFDPAQQN